MGLRLMGFNCYSARIYCRSAPVLLYPVLSHRAYNLYMLAPKRIGVFREARNDKGEDIRVLSLSRH
jgi:hypothetical protein